MSKIITPEKPKWVRGTTMREAFLECLERTDEKTSLSGIIVLKLVDASVGYQVERKLTKGSKPKEQ